MDPAAFASLTLLAWVARSDGAIAPAQMQVIMQVASTLRDPDEMYEAMYVARSGREEDLQLACELVQTLERTQQRRLLTFAVRVAVADGFLSIGENHALRLLTDVLGFPGAMLEHIFRDETGRPFPPPGDPSNVTWWEARERASDSQRRRERRQERQQQYEQRREQREDGGGWRVREMMDRSEALATLGLTGGASDEEIRKAYRKLAKLYHPDRCTHLPPDERRDAMTKFLRIQRAYERLSS
jgi:DnaJ like chaperone protein